MEEKQKRLVVGILAHVDAGKTTLAEAMLFETGALRKIGRVDHRDVFLDTDPMERERGITVFAKQAVLSIGDAYVTLVDTPGHTDFSTEAERTLDVLDYAILVVSASEGVQSHTRTLWQLLRRRRIPTFVFINKMDLPHPEKEKLLDKLSETLGSGFVDFCLSGQQFHEHLAYVDEHLMDEFLDRDGICEKTIRRAVAASRVFPVIFGSALRLEGVRELLAALESWTLMPVYADRFGAKVFRISTDQQGNCLTHVKVTGGVLRVKEQVAHFKQDGEKLEAKADQLRVYSGTKYSLTEQVPAGMVCAITGLEGLLPGDGLGNQEDSRSHLMEPVVRYRVVPERQQDKDRLLSAMRILGREDPTLQVACRQAAAEDGASVRNGEITVMLMGKVQQELLASQLERRFQIKASFATAGIVYRETIADSVKGYGHFEPLRHYAEVHLRIDPLPRGSGLRFQSECSRDLLDRNWQRLILTHLQERQFPGVLTGSPVTDMCFTVIAGRAHEKHTEGGDFRQATYRAVRQGLRSAKSILLEPWFHFELEVPAANVGRAMSDMTRMCATFSVAQTNEQTSVLEGELPASELGEYQRELSSFTGGMGRLSLLPCGYRECHNPEKVIESIGYNADADYENTADSVFCSHGVGENVPWQEAPARMHIVEKKQSDETDCYRIPARSAAFRSRAADDKELMAIFERTYGAVKKDPVQSAFRSRSEMADLQGERRNTEHIKYMGKPAPAKEYLLVDGYNIIFAWEELSPIAQENLDAARLRLMDILCSYRGYHGGELILVFDAYRVKGNPGTVEKTGGITVVYTREAETADAYIVKASHELAKDNIVRVATSDSMEQMIIIGKGALRISAREFHDEIMNCERALRDLVATERASGYRFGEKLPQPE